MFAKSLAVVSKSLLRSRSVPQALEKCLLDKLWLWHFVIDNETVAPVIPTPLELEVAQVVAKPIHKPTAKENFL